MPAARDHAGAALYRWKAKYGGMEVSEARRLRALEEENRQLKHIVAEQAVDIRALKAVVAKSGEPAAAARGGAGDAGGSRAEPATRLWADGTLRGTSRYRKRRSEDGRLRTRLRGDVQRPETPP
jgi:hypothetical protein